MERHTNRDTQNPVLHAPLDLALVSTIRQSHSTLKTPKTSFADVSSPFIRLLAACSLSGNNEDAVLDSHVDLILLEAGEVEGNDELVGMLDEIKTREPNHSVSGIVGVELSIQACKVHGKGFVGGEERRRVSKERE
jgi:hypothetical protein